MVEHIRGRELPLKIVRVVPFAHVIDGKAPQIEGPAVCYGSIGVAKVAADNGWQPGVFTDPNTFHYEAYRDALGDLILNADAVRLRMSEVSAFVAERRWTSFFIKPNDDAKAFAGAVMEADEFETWVSRMREIGYLDENDIDVVVSEPKPLGVEWRVIVVDGEIVESSIYKQWGRAMAERHRQPEVDAVVRAAHARFVPAPVYVIDVAQVGDDYKVIEYNTFNSAGLYACDVGRVVDAVTAYVERAYATTPA
nr:ATP-grasp domain-containing protein [Caulobacter sp. 17J65-9]